MKFNNRIKFKDRGTIRFFLKLKIVKIKDREVILKNLWRNFLNLLRKESKR